MIMSVTVQDVYLRSIKCGVRLQPFKDENNKVFCVEEMI